MKIYMVSLLHRATINYSASKELNYVVLNRGLINTPEFEELFMQ